MSLRNRQDDACILSSARTHSMASDRYDSAGWWPGATRHPGCYLHGRRLHSSFFWSSPHVLVWTVRISCALASHCSFDHPHLWKQQKHNQHCTQQQHTLSLGSNHGLAAPCSLQVHVRRPSFRQSGGATGPSDGSTYNTQLYMSHLARMDGVHGANCIHVPHFSLAAYYRLQPRLIADVG